MVDFWSDVSQRCINFEVASLKKKINFQHFWQFSFNIVYESIFSWHGSSNIAKRDWYDSINSRTTAINTTENDLSFCDMLRFSRHQLLEPIGLIAGD